MECLIVPDVTIRQVEEALKLLYLRMDAKPFFKLICPENFGISEVDDKQVLKVDTQERLADPFEETVQIDEKLEVKLSFPGFLNEIKEEPPELEESKSEATKGYGNRDKSKRKPYKIKCLHCDTYIKGKQAFRKHLKEIHNLEETISEEEEVQCQICGKTLKHFHTLKNHINEVHGDKTYTCTTCGVSLGCQRTLNTHMLTHNKPTIPCEQCGKLFKRKDAVRSHINKFHLQIRNFFCDQCDKRFADAKHLREHVTAIHDKLKPFACEICDFKCARTDNLNVHRRKTHGILTKLTRAEHDELVRIGQHPFLSKKK